MNISEYQTLTGITVPTSQAALVTAMIAKSQRILEGLLGYTLDITKADDNQYTELGKTQFECQCPELNPTLDPPDVVIGAYRLFPYNKSDKFFSIDPASAVHAVKLVIDDITYRTIPVTEYRPDVNRGIIKYLEKLDCICLCAECNCNNMQLAVDATWLWTTTLPTDLLDVLCDMTTYYSDAKNELKSETLGSHSYSRNTPTIPEQDPRNLSIISRYAGPLGSVKTTITK